MVRINRVRSHLSSLAHRPSSHTDSLRFRIGLQTSRSHTLLLSTWPSQDAVHPTLRPRRPKVSIPILEGGDLLLHSPQSRLAAVSAQAPNERHEEPDEISGRSKGEGIRLNLGRFFPFLLLLLPIPLRRPRTEEGA